MSVLGRELAEEEAKRYVNRNLAMFQRVQVSQMIHLPCFTETDRQTIRARCNNEGNNETTFIFFQRLCCREGWVLPFVCALREQQMGDLADKLETLYCSKLLPPPRTLPAASTPPAANRPLAPPSQPEARVQGLTENQAFPWSPPRSATSSANPPTQDTGDCRTPVQENSHPAEKSKLAVHPNTTDKGAEPGFPSTSDVSSASNIEAAVGGSGAIESPDPVVGFALVRGPVEERPLPSQMISTSAAGIMEQKWDGRQHRPVTVKNGRFGNAHRPEESGTGSALPTGASDNQPEEDYYSSDSVLFALGGQTDDSAAERKVHVLRGDRKREDPPDVAPPIHPRSSPESTHRPFWMTASQGSPENQTQPFMEPSSRRAPVNDAQPSLTRTGTKPPLLAPGPVPEHPICLPPSDLGRSSSVETKSPKPPREVSAAGDSRPSDDLKLPVEEKRSLEETAGTGASAGRPQPGTETRPSAVRDRKRDSRIFHSNCSEDDMPSKPGVLSSVHAAEPSKLSSGDAGETSNRYSGSSERLRMSIGDPISVSTSDSDPILMSEISSVGQSTMSTGRGRNGASGAADATLPPEVDTGEEDTSFRIHHVLVEENQSMDLMGVPMDGASSRPSLKAFPDSTSDGQPLNKAKDPQADPSPLEETAGFSDDFWMFLAGCALAFLAISAAYVLYKKK